jgi:glycosyltransferase involved in cell wall biosynthesis
MIRRKNSWISKLFDFLLVIPIIKRAQLCFVLTEAEGKDLKKVYAQAKTYILRNGYDFDKWSLVRNDDSNKIRVVFCSRLHATKGVRHFCELAKHYSNDKRYVFEIYGPDGGELFWIENFLKDYPGDNLIYRGSVSSSEVLGILSKSDLLVLPSTYDPYPMIILEALCTGTPLLVNSVCGQSSELSNIYPSYVYKGQDSVSLIQAFKKLEPIKTDLNVRTQIRSSCRNIFGIESVWENLRKCYEQTTEMRSGGK